ncbi:MAG: SDR family oxidoreductase [SAR324 cluster bacterium]|nr:SDR family oxidoreductase [SAR324 cluster bacterium]
MLEGKVALITGAGRGIGRGMALLMASKGAKVIVNDIGTSPDGEGTDATPAEEVVAEIEAAGGEAVANGDSVTEFEGATNMVKQALDTFGGLHIIVNNAGILRDRMLHKMSPEDWLGVLAVHLTGHFNVTRAAINHFREQEWGRIINFTSTSGIVGNLGQTNYGSAKLGIFAFTRILALETSRFENITANAISPFAYTRMIATIPVKDEASKARVEKIKKMKAEDIAPVVTWLCSEEAKAVSGQIFGVRAGEIMIFSQPRPTRSIHRNGGWTPEEVGGIAMPALRPFFEEPQVSADIFPYDPMD